MITVALSSRRARAVRFALAVIAIATAAALAGTPAGAATDGPPGAGCHTINVAVALTPGGPSDQTVSAQYCTPAGRATAIDILIPGATYDHFYWDWPVDPSLYNFTDKALAAGDAVLAYDRPGTGGSTVPPSASVTATSDVYVLHQIIDWVRSSGYTDVNLIGHSLGSFIAVEDAGTWPGDPSRLVLTGYLNALTPEGDDVSADFYPANLDPEFARDTYDSAYLTTEPGTRAALFYYQGNPAVEAYDEAHKSVVSAAELAQLVTLGLAPPGVNLAGHVRAPVMIVVGQDDALLCTGGPVNCASWPAIHSYEAPYFTSAASLTTISIPRTGHDVALSQTADISGSTILAWLVLTPPNPAGHTAGDGSGHEAGLQLARFPARFSA